MTTFIKNGIEAEMPDDDEKSRQNMIIAAEFMARVIRKYGEKLLAKIEAKEKMETSMTEDEIRGRNEERRAKLDVVSRRNMEKCAAFIAKMIRKYGPEVLAEIEAEEKAIDTFWRE